VSIERIKVVLPRRKLSFTSSSKNQHVGKFHRHAHTQDETGDPRKGERGPGISA